MVKKDTEVAEEKTYSVSSGSRSPRTVSFTVPTLPRPDFERVRRAGSGRYRSLLMALAIVVLGVLGGFGGAWLQDRTSTSTGVLNSSLSGQKKIVTSQGQLINQIAKSVGPSVVSVNVTITTASTDQNSYDFFGFSQPNSSQQAEGAGTGIILNSNGIIMTNRHVVPAGTTNVSVTLSDGTEFKDVTVLGRTTTSDSLDVAFLKINDLKGHKLTPATIGNSSQVQVGDAVVAIGNALGQFQNTVTSGIISGYGRSVQASADDGSGQASSSDTENLDNLFQTDAAINEGNSGGPLVNLNGQVIGINTAIASDSQNIGFAIPINDVQGLIAQVLKTGKFERPYLGVRYIPLTADVASQYKLSVSNGAFIAPSSDPATPSVVAGSPADKANLQTNDIITELDSTKIDASHSLTSLLSQHQPGDSVQLTVLRDGKTLHVNVTLGTMPTTATQ